MNKKAKILLIGLLIVVASGFLGYRYVMTAGARDLSSEDAEFSVESKAIIDEFSKKPDLSSKKYQNKAIQISGIVTNADEKQVILNESIICELDPKSDNNIKLEQNCTIKGRFVGYDDLLGELKLDQCSLTK